MLKYAIFLILTLFTSWNNCLYSFDENNLLSRLAIAVNDNDLVQVLQKYGKDPNVPALNKALEANDINAAMLLLEYGVDVNKRGPKTSVSICGHRVSYYVYNDGQNALEIAIEKRALSIVPVLLSKGADPYSIRKLQYSPPPYQGQQHSVFCRDTTALSEAIDNNLLDFVSLFYDLNINMNAKCYYHGSTGNVMYTYTPYTPLQFAISFNHQDIANFLIAIGAKID